MKTLDPQYSIISEEVKVALSKNLPIVALESTIISHGMPWPKNYETALEVQEEIRKKGVVPATIAIIDGVIRVGLSDNEIENLAKSDDVMKVSRRDLPYVILKKRNGATTVASTMIIAAATGINIFATGGIGGVHRGFSDSLDISADLTELSQTNVAVVCAGIKSILDIKATLEYLETQGVPVVGYQSEELAAFYTKKSGESVDFKLDSAKDIADFLNLKWNQSLKGGVVISNPIPEEYSMDRDEINNVISESLIECDRNGIVGKAITPFLLNNIKSITKGRSLIANIELIKNNARLASEIALHMAG